MNENIFVKSTYSKDHFELYAFRNLVEIESVTFSGNIISIEPKVAIESINSVIVKYNVPSDNNARLKNIVGNLIQDDFTLIGAVDNTVPTFISGEIIGGTGNDAGKIRLTFSEYIGKKPNYVGTDFRLKLSGVLHDISNISIDGGGRFILQAFSAGSPVIIPLANINSVHLTYIKNNDPLTNLTDVVGNSVESFIYRPGASDKVNPEFQSGQLDASKNLVLTFSEVLGDINYSLTNLNCVFWVTINK